MSRLLIWLQQQLSNDFPTRDSPRLHSIDILQDDECTNLKNNALKTNAPGYYEVVQLEAGHYFARVSQKMACGLIPCILKALRL